MAKLGPKKNSTPHFDMQGFNSWYQEAKLKHYEETHLPVKYSPYLKEFSAFLLDLYSRGLPERIGFDMELFPDQASKYDEYVDYAFFDDKHLIKTCQIKTFLN